MTAAKHTLYALLFSLVAACAVTPPDNSLAYRPGVGVVQDVRNVRVAVPQTPGTGTIIGSAAAGGSYGTPAERLTRPRWTEGRQLTLQMEDGSRQSVTLEQDFARFGIGDRVQVTTDGRVVKL